MSQVLGFATRTVQKLLNNSHKAAKDTKCIKIVHIVSMCDHFDYKPQLFAVKCIKIDQIWTFLGLRHIFVCIKWHKHATITCIKNFCMSLSTSVRLTAGNFLSRRNGKFG